jgi:diguanylate cyclase (GGDEF)-like protein
MSRVLSCCAELDLSLTVFIVGFISVAVVGVSLWMRATRKHPPSMGAPAGVMSRLTQGDSLIEVLSHEPLARVGDPARPEDRQPSVGRLLQDKAKLERAIVELNLALNNMTLGVCMYDAQQRLILCNRHYAQMYDIPPELTKQGTSYRQILEHRTPGKVSPDQAVREIVRFRTERRSITRELNDGRVIAVSHHPIDNGGWFSIHEDVTDRRRAAERIAYMAHHDSLTGLANRMLFLEKIGESGARSRQSGETFTVLLLDLDRFKLVNDSLGHPAGDELLRETARRLKSSLSETDVVARLGGDEFAAIQVGAANQRERAITLARKLINVISEPFQIDGSNVSVGVSIGISLAPGDGIEPNDLLKMADLALYEAKSKGRNGFSFFRSEMLVEAEANLRLENELRDAMLRNEFELHYQPVVIAKTGQVCTLEALVRWRHPARGLIYPGQFIKLAENTGLIVPLGAWILRRACADAALWPTHIKVAVNLSPAQFRGNLLEIVRSTLAETQLPAERLELEITESLLMENDEDYPITLQQLSHLGIRICLDDFGTGYSSLTYLTKFPFHKIKIDRSFTQGLLNSVSSLAVVSSVVTLASGLEITAVAEGVETQEQLDLLRAAGVSEMQGHLFGQPRAISDLCFSGFDVDGKAEVA